MAGDAVEARVVGRSPWALAGRRLRRNRIALVALGGFIVIVVLCLGAGFYANHIAHTDPFVSTIDGTTIINGKPSPVMVQSTGGLGLGVTPIGPTWDIHHYFLGADNQGRDVMARLLYGGRNSLLIGIGSALICCVLATILALIAGFYGGVDRQHPLASLRPDLGLPRLPRRHLDLDGRARRAASTSARSRSRPGSLWLPTLIISLVYVPYVARPIRGEVLSVREKEFVEAGIGLGANNRRLIFSDVLPNVITTVIVFFPLMIATCMLTEAALSFLSIGVQPPNASWGTIINDGQGLLYTRPWVAIAPGLAIVATVLCLNVLGDGIRDALDPRARLRFGRQAATMIAFIIRRLLSTLLVMFTLSVLVFLIFFATPGRRSGVADRRPQRQSADARAGASRLRPRPAAARAVRDHDEEALLEPRPDVVRRIAAPRSSRRSPTPTPVTLSLVIGAAIIWVFFAIVMGVLRGRHARHVRRPVDHDHRADRHLDAGLLAGRGGQPRHAEPSARRAVLLAAAARLHPVHDLADGLVQVPALPVDHALGALHRLLQPGAAVEHARGPGRRTSCAPRAPRG